MGPLLEVEDLKTEFKTDAGVIKAVDGVSLHINENEIVGLVGESGCGKSVTMLSVMQLISNPPGKIVSGRVNFEGRDLLKLESEGPEMRSVRGGKIAIIFQEPMTSLNPALTINRQISETLKLHLGLDREAARNRAKELLQLVGIPAAESRLDDYPHQFSGGMRQRVMIAMAIACNPKLLIADEPTTALDVTIQAQILDLMKNTVAKLNTSLVIVTHNLGVIARYAKRIYVMYAGRIVESGPVVEMFHDQRHPYTIGLLNSVPRLDEPLGRRLVPIKGMPPNLINMPDTCSFLPRCGYATEECRRRERPELLKINEHHYASCYVDVRNKG